jgi:hypothetical protein
MGYKNSREANSIQMSIANKIKLLDSKYSILKLDDNQKQNLFIQSNRLILQKSDVQAMRLNICQLDYIDDKAIINGTFLGASVACVGFTYGMGVATWWAGGIGALGGVACEYAAASVAQAMLNKATRAYYACLKTL